QPGPARAESRRAGGIDFLFESVKAAERASDGLRHMAHRSSTRARTHDGPEHGVVDVAAAVIAYRGADLFGNDGANVGQQFLYGLAREFGRRFQSLGRIWHRRKWEWHISLLYFL